MGPPRLPLVTAAEMKAVEGKTVAGGTSEREMIRMAGGVVFRTARDLAARGAVGPGPWTALCGKGHNGADALQAALLTARAGIEVRVFQLQSSKGYSPETRAIQGELKEAGLEIRFLTQGDSLPLEDGTALILDGLLGAGLSRPARGQALEIIRRVVKSGLPVLSIDVPSGLPTEGPVLGESLRALGTVVLGTHKLSALFEPTRKLFGSIVFDPLCFSPDHMFGQPSNREHFGTAAAAASLPRPAYDASKYSRGKVLVVAGSAGMHGAALLASRAALRSGAGLVRLAVPGAVLPVAAAASLEVICMGVGDSGAEHFLPVHVDALAEWLDWADAVVLGPGLGKDPGTLEFLREIAPRISSPLVVDGDGQALLRPREAWPKSRPDQPVVATPHAGEFRRLSGLSPSPEPLPRMKDLREAATAAGIGILLKGPTSLFSGPDGRVLVLEPGSPALATAGTGDVLAGALGAMLCHLPPDDAAGTAVYLHSEAARLAAARLGPWGIVAGDLLEDIPRAIASLA